MMRGKLGNLGLRSWWLLLVLLPALAMAQQPSPIQQFITGLQGEFNAAVPFLVTIIGIVFTFAWLVRFVMAKVRQASR